MKSIFINFLAVVFFISSIYGSMTSVEKVELAGDIFQVALPFAGLASTYFLDDKNGRNQFWDSYLTSISLTYFLKLAVDKTRPNGDCCESFPSGHTTAAFSGAMFIQRKYGFKYGFPSLLLSSYVAYSRVHANKHFLEDVVVGAWIGSLGNLIFTDRYVSPKISFYKQRDNFNLTVGIPIN